MKLILESWKHYIQESKFITANLTPNDKVFTTPYEYTEFKPVVQKDEPAPKPNGLWYACGSEWLDFDYKVKNPKYLYKLDIDYSRVLKLTKKDIKKFEKEYLQEHPKVQDYYMINWKKVAEKYSGIEICPFMQDIHDLAIFENLHIWYYGWDVASGCIWDRSAIKNVELLQEI